MQKTTRKAILISTILAFVVISPWILLRAQGIRFDFNQKKFVKTGGIFIDVLNPKVEIYLDGKLKRKISFLSNSIFIKNLLPKDHKIEVKKPGYFPWQKTLKVEEGKVTEIKNILLFKENPRFGLLEKDIKDFLISQDGKEMLVKRMKDDQWEFLIVNLLTNEIHKVFSSQDLGKDVKVKLIQWQENQKRILYQEITEPRNFIIVDYNLFPQTQIIHFSLKGNIKKIALNPLRENEILFLRENNLFRKNIKSEDKENLLLSNIIWFEIQDENLFSLDSSGFITRINLLNQKKEVINKVPLSFSQPAEFKIKIFKDTLFLEIGKTLFSLSPKGAFEKIFEGVEGFKISPNFQELVIWGNKEIWLFKDNLVFLNRFSQSPQFLFWLTSYHLIFNVGEEIKITETDLRDYLNIVTLKKFKNPKINFSNSLKKLYVLSEGNLFVSEKLIP